MEIFMDENQSRRNFLEKCAKIGGLCSALYLWNKNLLAQDSTKNKKDTFNESIDLKKYSYCGIPCESQCELFKATKENNIELKKQVYEKWKMKENRGFDFDPETVSCYSCKPGDRPYKFGIKECKVRICAIENSMESCIQCSDLASCDKEFWKKWKGLFKLVNNLQKQYALQPGVVLLEINNNKK
jgi:hypothetical protein